MTEIGKRFYILKKPKTLQSYKLDFIWRIYKYVTFGDILMVLAEKTLSLTIIILTIFTPYFKAICLTGVPDVLFLLYSPQAHVIFFFFFLVEIIRIKETCLQH